MGVVGILVAMLINMFLQSSAMALAISAIGVLLFAGLTAYDTQRIKSMYFYVQGTEMLGKTVIMGALPPLPGLHQHVPVPAELHGRPPLSRLNRRTIEGREATAGPFLLEQFRSCLGFKRTTGRTGLCKQPGVRWLRDRFNRVVLSLVKGTWLARGKHFTGCWLPRLPTRSIVVKRVPPRRQGVFSDVR